MSDADKPYPHQIPRILHQRFGRTKHVKTVDECEDALASGWLLRPPVWPPEDEPNPDLQPEPIVEPAALDPEQAPEHNPETVAEPAAAPKADAPVTAPKKPKKAAKSKKGA